MSFGVMYLNTIVEQAHQTVRCQSSGPDPQWQVPVGAGEVSQPAPANISALRKNPTKFRIGGDLSV